MHLSKLEQKGRIEIEKGFAGKVPVDTPAVR